MPFNGSGSFSRPVAAYSPNTTILSASVNAEMDGMATGLSTALLKDGTQVAAANQPMGGFKHTNVAVATARTEYARTSQVADSSLVYGGVAGGTADAATITLSPAITSYAIGQQFVYKTGAGANTTATTLNANGVGAGAETWPDGSAMAAGDKPANAMIQVVVQATTPVFHVVSVTKSPLTMLNINGLTTETSASSSDLLPVYDVSASANRKMSLADIFEAISGLNTDATPDIVADSMLTYDTSAGSAKRVTISSVLVSAGIKQIGGWTYANAAGDVTNDIDIAAGAGADSTGAYWIKGALSTKQLDAAWAVGTGAGGLDTGSIANTDYWIWTIARSDTGVVDYLFSTSGTAPTMPASYDYKRLFGWLRRTGGAIVLFKAWETAGGGLRHRWKTPVSSGSTALTTAYSTLVVPVPVGIEVEAYGNAVAPTGGQLINVRYPGMSDGTPSHTLSPGATAGSSGTSTTTGSVWSEMVNTSAQIEWAADNSVNAYLITKGFEWSRR